VTQYDIQTILDEVKEMLKPTYHELRKVLNLYDELKCILEDTLSKSIPYDFKVELEGSVAKGTAIRGEMDLDIFVLIRYENLSKEWIIEKFVKPVSETLSYLREGYRVELRYASHPYVKVYAGNVEADIVPAYWAKSIDDIRTPVDRTPFHTEFVKKHLTNEQCDEVRLLKKFFKGVGVYGAEIRVEGFSGYLTELLIIKYGSFEKFLKSVITWKEPQIISLRELNSYESSVLLKTFKGSPLILPDPVDNRRNAAAAVSRRSVALAMLAAHEFLKKPSLNFFFPLRRTLDIRELQLKLKSTERNTILILYKVAEETSPDIIWGELKSIGKRIANILRVNDFDVLDLRFWSDDRHYAAIYVEIHGEKLSAFKPVKGPTRIGVGLLNFFEKHCVKDPITPWVDWEGVPRALSYRKVRDPMDLLKDNKDLLNANHIKLSCITTNLLEKEIYDLRLNRDFLTWLSESVIKSLPWREEPM